ncbi:hypothetical protein [Streptomyces sp. CT34]|uniref:hypothetical protein n=1 Tax=Streptomyces sp. CT34 TaxID=1553907 RepID=UPI0012FE886C|nr:hypothetical protein [Streptomyces sp. CT34]
MPVAHGLPPIADGPPPAAARFAAPYGHPPAPRRAAPPHRPPQYEIPPTVPRKELVP